jgi:hypothetical protein
MRVAPLGPHGPYASEQFLERFLFHRGDFAVVVKENFVAVETDR